MSRKKRVAYLSICVSFVIASGYATYAYTSKSFKKTATGLEYRMIAKGKGPRPQEGEIMLLHMSYKTAKKVLLNTEDQGMPIAMPYNKDKLAQDGGVMEAVSMLQKGDTLLCKLDATKLFGENWPHVAQQHNLKQDSQCLLRLHLQDIMTKEEHQKWEKEQIAMLEQKHQEETAKQLQEDIKIISNHLTEQQITAQTTPSGLHYVIDTPGQGAHPKQGDTVKVNYTGQLLSGKVFDTSVESAAKEHGVHNPQRPYEPIAFKLGVGQVIQGWDEGICLLKQGGKGRLFIPSTLAYGSQDVGGGLIPANSVLVFEVELVEINK